MTFTVEISFKTSDFDINEFPIGEIQMFLDEDAIDYLIHSLEVIKRGKTHDHFMTPSWAGKELTEQKMGGSSNLLVNQMTIQFVPKDK